MIDFQAKSRRFSRGYTAIEVLIGLTIFAIGAAGVISMERAAVQGNVDARRLDTANSIARAWVERLRRDAMLWNTTGNLSQTTLINGSVTGAWVLPVATCPATSSTATPADGNCGAFDAFGEDLDTGHYPNAVFCVNYKLDLVAKDNASPQNPAVIRAIVRVYWPRGLALAPYSNAGAGFCSAGGLADLTSGPDAPNGPQIYHYVQTVTFLSNSLVPQ